MTTVRRLIDELNAVAGTCEAGLDTPVRFAICNGEDLQLIDRVDVDVFTEVVVGSPASEFIGFKGHHHPGEQPGRLLRGIAADVDDELRRLTDEGDEA